MKGIAGNGKQCLINYNWGCAHAIRIVVLAEGLDTFRLMATNTGGSMISSDNLSFVKRTLVGGMSGS
jgi:hypothetical protein